ncbi:hypothetical protein SEPL_190 [Salmonella phage SE_PL]|nr:hypothetical protein 7t3_0403 [Salmonella phage 7t3]QIG62803.1 hypothetical protein SEPL_190 [Salmonella phage SE_PL]WNV47343.1 hypothetical protein [Klebsiella phage fENko-Kae01]
MSMLEEMFEGANDNRETLNERPYSRTQSAIDAAKGKVKGAFGSGQIEQGAQEVGAEANKLWMDFKRYIGRKYGKAQQTVPYGDVVAFFQGNKLDPKFLGNNQRRSFTPKDVGQALLAAVREYMNEFPQDKQEEPSQQNVQPRTEPRNDTEDYEDQQPKSNPTGISDVLSGLSSAEREQLLRLLS